MTRIYHIGISYSYGNIIAVSENLSEVTKDDFFSAIDSSLEQYKLKQFTKAAKLIKNLKQGVTIGSDYYLIKDTNAKN